MKFVIDGDAPGKSGNPKKEYVEDMPQYNDQEAVTEIKEATELGEVLRELNKDELDMSTRMTGIDMRSRLHSIEISGILAVDSLVQFRLLPVSCLSFTRQKKRLSVSLNGAGRDDFVNIVSGKKDQDNKSGMTFGERVKGMFGSSHSSEGVVK